MLPVQPYHEGSYPPGAKFPQFGDDVIGGYLNAHAALAEKRRNMMPFHIGRLAQDGFLPLNHLPSQVPAAPANPEDQATRAFDRPPPPAAEPVFEDPQSDNEAQVHAPPSGGLGSTFMQGANSTLANMGAGVVHGITYVAGVGTAAAAKGIVRGLGHLATGVNPASVASDDEEEMIPDKPARAYPKAKAQSRSSGSRESPSPYPYPAQPFDVGPYNGTGAHAITISSDEEAPGPAAAAARPRNPVRRSDVELARQTLGGLGQNFGRGHRNR
jgi:hypothetical protein